MNQTLLLQKTGEQMELLIKLEIKEHVDHAGLSQQLLQWKEHTKLSMELLLIYPNNNLLIVTIDLKDVMGALHKMLSSMRFMLINIL